MRAYGTDRQTAPMGKQRKEKKRSGDVQTNKRRWGRALPREMLVVTFVFFFRIAKKKKRRQTWYSTEKRGRWTGRGKKGTTKRGKQKSVERSSKGDPAYSCLWRSNHRAHGSFDSACGIYPTRRPLLPFCPHRCGPKREATAREKGQEAKRKTGGRDPRRAAKSTSFFLFFLFV